MAGFGYGYGYGVGAQARFGARPPSIMLVGNAVQEDAPVAALVGIFSILGGSGAYVFTLDLGGASFSLDDQLDNTAELLVAGALDFETSPSIAIAVTADNGVDPPLVWSGNIVVVDVSEGGPDFGQLDFSDADNSGWAF